MLEKLEKHPKSAQRVRDFVLTVRGDLISLWAQEASLKAILEALGQELAIDVVARIPDVRTTVAFDKLPLAEAMKRLHTNYAYLVDAGRGEGTITKIIVLPQGEDTVLSRPEGSVSEKSRSKQSPRLEPFKFEFDPSKFMQKGK